MRRPFRLLPLVLAATLALASGCISPSGGVQTDQKVYAFTAALPLPAESTLAVRELRRERPEEAGEKGRLVDDVPEWLLELVRGTGTFGTVVVGEREAGDYVMDVSYRQKRRLSGVTFTTAFVLPGLFGFFPIIGLPVIYAATDVSAEVRLFRGETPISLHTAVLPTSGFCNWYMFWGRVGYATEHYQPELRAMIEGLVRDAAKVAASRAAGGG